MIVVTTSAQLPLHREPAPGHRSCAEPRCERALKPIASGGVCFPDPHPLGTLKAGLPGSVEAWRRRGAKKVLPKPFTRKELLPAVAASLEGRVMHAALRYALAPGCILLAVLLYLSPVGPTFSLCGLVRVCGARRGVVRRGRSRIRGCGAGHARSTPVSSQ